MRETSLLMCANFPIAGKRARSCSIDAVCLSLLEMTGFARKCADWWNECPTNRKQRVYGPFVLKYATRVQKPVINLRLNMPAANTVRLCVAIVLKRWKANSVIAILNQVISFSIRLIAR